MCNCAVAIYTDFYKAKGLIYPWKLRSYTCCIILSVKIRGICGRKI
nr:MAG TPA: hypothetical protein [Caudoviricetes sp.]